MTIRIDPAFERLMQPLSDAEYAQLEANLLAEGCPDALVLWAEEGILLDGHHRLRICEAHSIAYQTRTLSFPDREAAMVWMIANQLGRRNSTPMHISDMRGKRYHLEKLREGSGQIEGNKNAEKQKAQNEPFVLEPEEDEPENAPGGGDTAQRLADEYGVTRETIKRDAEFSSALDTLDKSVSPTMRQSITAPSSTTADDTTTEAQPADESADEPLRQERPTTTRQKERRPTKQKVVEVARTVKEQEVVMLPFMRRGRWTDYAVLEAMSRLAGIPTGEHASINALLDQEGIPVQNALDMLKHLREFSGTRRQHIYDLFQSEDIRERSLALTMAAQLPPNPDPQVLELSSSIRVLETQANAFAQYYTRWPDEHWSPAYLRMHDALVSMIDDVKSIQQSARAAHNERISRHGEIS
jgi:hypothetical protein